METSLSSAAAGLGKPRYFSYSLASSGLAGFPLLSQARGVFTDQETKN